MSDAPEADFARWLTTKVGVAAIPLSVFTNSRRERRHVRLCFAKKDETLATAIERLQAVLKVIPRNTCEEVAMASPAIRPVAIKLDDDTKARVKRLAEARQRTSHWVMREAIAQYVVREEQREAFRLQTQGAWLHHCGPANT